MENLMQPQRPRHFPLFANAFVILVSLALTLTATGSFADPPGTAQTIKAARSTPKEAKVLLDSAADFLKLNTPERAFAAFNNQKGKFVRGDLYVFVVGLDGIMHAHGGAVEGLVGMNVMDLRDAAGKPLIKEMLDAVQSAESGSIEYVWLNRTNNRVEDKLTQFRKVGNYVIGVGSYMPRSSAEQAKTLLKLAIAELEQVGPNIAFVQFNAKRGRFRSDDLYVFAIGVDDGRFYAMGATPEIVGNDVRGLKDASGKPIIADMLQLAKEGESTLYEYVWRNPANNKVENKHSFVQRSGSYVIGVGYYTK